MKKPKVILKFAKCANGFIGKKDHQVWLTNPFSKRLTHKWRSEIDGILVGKNTVKIDNPSLTTRFGFGKSPFRIVLGKSDDFPKNYHIFNPIAETFFYDKRTLNELLIYLKTIGINTLMVEGGATILSAFIKKDLWDEARIFTVEKRVVGGIKAPTINASPVKTFNILKDKLEIFHSKQHSR